MGQNGRLTAETGVWVRTGHQKNALEIAIWATDLAIRLGCDFLSAYAQGPNTGPSGPRQATIGAPVVQNVPFAICFGDAKGVASVCATGGLHVAFRH